MHGYAAHREVRDLLNQTVTVVGEYRSALIAGCSTDAIRTWQRQKRVCAVRKTVDQYLPRLRTWEDFIASYMVETEEVRRLQSDETVPFDLRAPELLELLAAAESTYTLAHVACGCEVHVSSIKRWRAGVTLAGDRSDFLRALGHLRHLANWPAPITSVQSCGAFAGCRQ